MRRNALLCFGALALSALVSACASIGLQAPASFEDHIANAYSTLSAARDTSTTLAQHGKLTKEDFADFIDQCDNARESIEVARALYSTNAVAGQQRLDTVITILNALNAYLEKRQSGTAAPSQPPTGASLNERRRRAISFHDPDQSAHQGQRASLFAAAGGGPGASDQRRGSESPRLG